MNYERIYNRLIERARNRKKDLSRYYENHHVLPRCKGGSNRKSNRVDLFAEEHYLAHLLLHRMYPEDRQLEWAYLMMILCKAEYQKRKVVSNKAYKEARERLAQLNRDNIQGRRHIYNPETGDGKLVTASEIKSYKALGYVLGSKGSSTKGRIQIRKEGRKKYIEQDQLSAYEKEGWEKGGLSISNGGWNGARKGKNNPTYGKIAVHSPVTKERRYVAPDEFDSYIDRGFKKGRGPNLV